MNRPLLGRPMAETALLAAATVMGANSYRFNDSVAPKRLVNMAADILDEIESREPKKVAKAA